VEDTGKYYRFCYSPDILRWAINPPGFEKDWVIGVRVSKNKKLVGFISGIPVKTVVNGESMVMAEIDFLCVMAKLRTKRLAPVLIKEITRRINAKNVWQAIYTIGKYLPMPISESNYYYRTLNYKKMSDINFVTIPPKSNLKRQEKIYKLPDALTIPGIRKMVKKDAKQILPLLKAYLSKFAIYPDFSVKELKHLLVPRSNVVDTYVVEESVNEKEKKITDFVSFYTVDCGVLKHEAVAQYKGAYVFYYASTKTSVTELVKQALIAASNSGHDIFFCLNIMENKQFFEELKFTKGSGKLMYYLYNYATKNIPSEQLGFVLV